MIVNMGALGVEGGDVERVKETSSLFSQLMLKSFRERLRAPDLPGSGGPCVCLLPGNDMGWNLSFLAASELKTSSPLVWQETFEATAKTSVSFSLATKGFPRDRLKA